MPDAIAALERLSDAVGRARGIEEIFDRALDCLRKALSAERAAVLLFDGEGVMRFAAHHGLSAEYRRAVEGHSPWTAGATDARPIFVEDVCGAPELAALLPVLEREGIRALGFVPLTYGGRLLGKFMVYYHAPHAPDRIGVQVARIVAGHIAFAVAQERSRIALSEAKDELESFFAVVGDAIVVHDGSGGLRYINDAGARAAGFSSVAELRQAMTRRSEMEGYAEFFDEAGRRLAVDELPGGIALRERRPAQGVFRARLRGSDEDRWYRSSAEPVLDEAGQIRFVVTVGRDITEHRRALDAAREAEERKDEFLAMLGHELRNPLSPIVTALSLMDLDGGDHYRRERAIIGRQVRHMLRLVDDLLDVSRITRGKLELHRHTIDARETVRRAVEMTSPIFEQRRHALEVDLPEEPLWVDADADRLGQVISNLLTNAAKYTDPGGHVQLRAWRSAGEVRVSVRDDGVGIAPEVAPRLFELFAQGPQRLDRARGGLGLGLSIVRRLVELHGGSVRVESAGPGRGTEALIALPLASLRRSAPPPRPVPAAPEPGTASARVLVVDDNADAAETIASTLEALGYTTAVAHDGPAAMREAERFAPDVAVLDIGLPVMDGYELGRRLRERHEALRIIALTGYGQERDRARALEAGFAAHLVKPVELPALLGALGPQ